MKTEKGVIIAAYKQGGRNPRFLVLKRTKNWEGWEIPKGHLENDDYRDTVRIELEEEAGIKEEWIESIREMDEEASWTYERDGEEFKKEYRAFVVKIADEAHVDTSNNPDDEHETGFFFRSRDAKSLITYDNNLEILEKAEETIG